MKTLKDELEDLMNARTMIESREFQDFIMKPLYEELDRLGEAYDQNSLRELATLKGKKWGLKWIIERLKDIENDYQNKKAEFDDSPTTKL